MQAAYIAGFFDGEGHVSASGTRRRGQYGYLNFAQKDPDILERILKTYPGGLLDRRNNSSKTSIWRLTYNGIRVTNKRHALSSSEDHR